ncbi:DUF4282 domain-containing protein [Thiohalophilus sp.]|uniref:DUF4282 domain-containing protein n=1 Tax=Thiohalophilus sp. TaxID=3028392 RepID=UPI002ACEDB1E|nr:DUF4282 domain-containing protein [Thiohalophilus sp.]MDZ7661362.1 DUF4282 domain-containing protein [Thiohalophilus sp.]
MDYLTFNTFISIEVLIVFYYLGAVILPVGAWFVALWLLRKYQLLGDAYQKGKTATWDLLNKQQRFWLVLFGLVFFLLMELFWRLLFEFLIAYMQMRDALVQG